MPRRLTLPDTANVATPGPDGRLHAPSAERNVKPLCTLIAQIAPQSGNALEIASGTGQHVIAFAQTCPGLIWQPTEIDPVRQTSITAWSVASGQRNIRPVTSLDAATPGWGTDAAQQDLIVMINLLHLISDREAGVAIAEAAKALAPGGQVLIYGPFMRAGELTSEGDAAFHASLTRQDPEIGYKDDFDTLDKLEEAGLTISQVVEMPANNLALIALREF